MHRGDLCWLKSVISQVVRVYSVAADERPKVPFRLTWVPTLLSESAHLLLGCPADQQHDGRPHCPLDAVQSTGCFGMVYIGSLSNLRRAIAMPSQPHVA